MKFGWSIVLVTITLAVGSGLWQAAPSRVLADGHAESTTIRVEGMT